MDCWVTVDFKGLVLWVIVRCTHLKGLKLINHLLAHSDKVFKSLVKLLCFQLS